MSWSKPTLAGLGGSNDVESSSDEAWTTEEEDLAMRLHDIMSAHQGLIPHFGDVPDDFAALPPGGTLALAEEAAAVVAGESSAEQRIRLNAAIEGVLGNFIRAGGNGRDPLGRVGVAGYRAAPNGYINQGEMWLAGRINVYPDNVVERMLESPAINRARGSELLGLFRRGGRAAVVRRLLTPTEMPNTRRAASRQLIANESALRTLQRVAMTSFFGPNPIVSRTLVGRTQQLRRRRNEMWAAAQAAVEGQFEIGDAVDPAYNEGGGDDGGDDEERDPISGAAVRGSEQARTQLQSELTQRANAPAVAAPEEPLPPQVVLRNRFANRMLLGMVAPEGVETADDVMVAMGRAAIAVLAQPRPMNVPTYFAVRLFFRGEAGDRHIFQTGAEANMIGAMAQAERHLREGSDSDGVAFDARAVEAVEVIMMVPGGLGPAPAAGLGATHVTRVVYGGLIAGQGELERRHVPGREEKDGWLSVTNLREWAFSCSSIIPIPTSITADVPEELLAQCQNLCVFLALSVAPIFRCDRTTGMQKEVVFGQSGEWTRCRVESELLGPARGHGRVWLESAASLRDALGFEAGKPLSLPDDLQALSDKTRLYIHIIDRKAGNQATYNFVPKGALNTALKFEEDSNHIYIYMIENHAHVITKPLQLLRGERTRSCRFLCHFCQYDTNELVTMKRHMESCPIWTDEDESSVQTGRSFGSFRSRYNKPDFRKTGAWEPRHAPFCVTCGEYRALITSKCKQSDYRAKKRGPETLAETNEEDPGDAGLTRLMGYIARRAEIDRRLFPVRREELLSAGQQCMDKGHEVIMAELEVCTHCRAMSRVGHRERHRCYCAVPILPKPKADESLWFYDFESVEEGGALGRQHRVVFVCLSNHNATVREEFGSLEEFCAHIFDYKKYDGATFIAHNASRYDGQFILGWLLRNGAQPSFNKLAGLSSKTLQIEWAGRRFIDSYCFLPFGLGAFGKTFKLAQGKDHFPHSFATMERWSSNYAGAMPGIEFYGVGMVRAGDPAATQEAVDELYRWHAAEVIKYEPYTDRPWSLQEQMKVYCRLDVEVLRQGCLIFRRTLMGMSGGVAGTDTSPGWTYNPVDPFVYMTQAQLGLNMFLAGVPPGLRIAHFPFRAEYRSDDKTWSWISYVEGAHASPVSHRGNEPNRGRLTLPDDMGEITGWQSRTVNGERVDVALIYLDCAEHGCPNCMTDRRARNPMSNKTYDMLLEDTRQRMLKICQYLGSEDRVEFTWACRWAVHMEDMRVAGDGDQLEELQISGLPIAVSDYFSGGRVEVFWPLVEVDGTDYTIEHVDVTSMYPWACATCELPHGHPTIIMEREIDRSRVNAEHPDAYFGVIKCTMIPPPNVIIPTLPSRREYSVEEGEDDAEAGEKRLRFTAARQTGSWTTAEIYAAMEQGYTVGRVFEVHHFPPAERITGLFRGYVDYWLRIKIEAEGWPSGLPEDGRTAWCDEVERQNGGMGRPREECVDKNPGQRALAKLMLNSLWGKFAQRARTQDHAYVSTPGKFDDLFMNPFTNKSTMRFMEYAPDAYLATFSLTERCRQSPSRSNLYLAAFVTAYARRKLHGYMHEVGTHRVVYCDTDSVVYVQPRGRQLLTCAPGLGNLTNEVDGGVTIEKFYSSGPKSYCKVYSDGSYEMKQKGLTLNHANLQMLTPEVMRQAILDVYHGRAEQGDTVVHLDAFSIRSAMHHGTVSVFSRNDQKKYSVAFSKRTLITRAHTGLSEEDPRAIPTIPHGLDSDLVRQIDSASMTSCAFFAADNITTYPILGSA